MSQPNWQEHFKEQLQGLRELFEQSETSLSFLGYALQEKRLSAEEYLKWAQKAYQLPSLHSRFFLEAPLSQEMFAKWATHYRWSVECLPVAEWDGSLIVACLEPPQDFPQTPTFSLVLAEPEPLQQAWIKLNPPQEKAAEPVASPTMVAANIPDGLTIAIASTSPAKKEGFSAEDIFGQQPEEKQPDSAGTKSAIVIEEKEEQQGLLHLDPVATPPVLVKLDIPEFKESTSDEAPLVAPPKQISSEEIEKTTVTKIDTKITKPVVPASHLPTQNPTENAEENRAIPQSSATSSMLKGKPQSHPAPPGSFALEKIKKQQGPLIAEKIKRTLTDMKTHFKKAMILTVDENESQIMAFAWDESFQGIPDTSVRIPLKTPSIFNIVASTQKPFHGYVSLNQLNEKFFEDWNHGSIPDHVTITPVIVEDKVIAMLMGFADKSAYNKSSLLWAEKLSAEFIKDLAA